MTVGHAFPLVDWLFIVVFFIYWPTFPCCFVVQNSNLLLGRFCVVRGVLCFVVFSLPFVVSVAPSCFGFLFEPLSYVLVHYPAPPHPQVFVVVARRALLDLSM